MSEQVKGITIELNGDAGGLLKEINKVRNSTKDLDKELGYINRSLKFNPTNVTLWKQKQDVLKESIKKTEDNLDKLKATQKQLDANQVDKNSNEYRQLEREIIKCESKLKSYKKELGSISSARLKALSEGFKNAGKKAMEAGKALTMKVTAPILGVGVASVKAFNDVQEGLNVVTKKTGATGEALEEMQTSARNLAKEIPTDFATAGEAIGEVNTRFGTTGEELESLSAQYIKFSKINGTDLTNSIDKSQKALAAFGLSAKEAPGLLDALTKASQESGANVDTLTEGLIQNGTAFQEMGLTVEQSVEAMAQLEKSGANQETVMNGLRKALKQAAKDGVPLNEALSDLQDTILNGTDDMDGLTAAYELFGKSGDQIYGAVKNGTLDFEALGSAAKDTKGTLDSVFNETLTPADKFKTAMNSIKDTGYQLGSTVMEMLAPVLEILTEKLRQVNEWWTNLDQGTKKTIVKVAGIVAAIGPLVTIIGGLVSVVGTILGALASFGSVLAALASPVGIVIAIIGALIAVGVLLYKNWDKIKEKAKEVKDWVVKKWTELKASVTNLFNSIKTSISNIWNSIKETVKRIAVEITLWTLKKFIEIRDGVKTAFSAIKETATTIWKGIKTAITHPIETAWNFIKKIVDKIKNLFSGLSISLPKIKLPHFSIDPPGWKISDLLKGELPKLGIQWYKNGAIFTKPTLLNGGNGVGEAGAEAVLPLKKLWEEMDRRFENTGNTFNIYGAEGQSPKEIAEEVAKILIADTKRRTQAWA